MQDVHHVVNQIPLNNIDNIHISGSWPINSIVATLFIMNCIEGCKLLDANEVLLTDYRSYLVDINLERYFETNLSPWDQINRRIVNLARRSHREISNELIEE